MNTLTAMPSSVALTGSPFELERREHTTRGLHGVPRGVRSLQDRLTHLDLFSGIGGFALAAKWAGIRTIGFSEIEPFACRVLAKNFPTVPNYGDIRKLTGVRADIITGGFPCQPFSLAGERLGADDDRHLWPEMLRVIADARPTWVVGENVPGIIGLELDNVLSDLEALGYAAWPVVVPACAVDAKHRRERVWIVGHAKRDGRQPGRDDHREHDGAESRAANEHARPVADSEGGNGGLQLSAGHEEKDDESHGCREALADAAREPKRESADQADALTAGRRARHESRDRGADVPDTDSEQARRFAVAWSERSEWLAEPAVGRVAHGIPERVDRLRGLGNAIVPQVAFVFLDAIAALEFGGAVAGLRGGSAWEQTGGKAELSRAKMENVRMSDGL